MKARNPNFLSLTRKVISPLLLMAVCKAALADPACINAASQHHQVNSQILHAIMVVESGMRPNIEASNTNGTIDIGMGGINSMHLRSGMKLARFGIGRETLKDPCVNSYVAAWHLSQQIARYGNNWFGIAAYHSATPRYNSRYQILLHNALIKIGAYPAGTPKLAVPKLR